MIAALYLHLRKNIVHAIRVAKCSELGEETWKTSFNNAFRHVLRRASPTEHVLIGVEVTQTQINPWDTITHSNAPYSSAETTLDDVLKIYWSIMPPINETSHQVVKGMVDNQYCFLFLSSSPPVVKGTLLDPSPR